MVLSVSESANWHGCWLGLRVSRANRWPWAGPHRWQCIPQSVAASQNGDGRIVFDRRNVREEGLVLHVGDQVPFQHGREITAPSYRIFFGQDSAEVYRVRLDAISYFLANIFGFGHQELSGCRSTCSLSIRELPVEGLSHAVQLHRSPAQLIGRSVCARLGQRHTPCGSHVAQAPPSFPPVGASPR